MTINYYLSLLSPYAYLGQQRLNHIGTYYNIRIDYIPINMKLVFPRTGGLPLSERAPSRQKYRLQELQRWAKFLNIPLNLKPKHFPTDEWPATKLVLQAKSKGLDPSIFIFNCLKAVWVAEADIGDPKIIENIREQSGLPAKSLLDTTQDDLLRKLWKDNSQGAINKGVFGVPSYIYDNQIFWGQDRLDFLERTIIKSKSDET